MGRLRDGSLVETHLPEIPLIGSCQPDAWNLLVMSGVYGVVQRQLRIILPAFMGAVSVPLLIWEIYNEAVVTSVGMGWDMGPPVWPYQAPEILLWFLNFPAHAIGQPLANLMGLVVPKNYLILFPFTMLWWWFVGWRIDRSRVSRKTSRRRKIYALGLGAISLGFMCIVAYIVVDLMRLWFDYHTATGEVLRFVHNAGPLGWCLFLGSWAGVAAIRHVRIESKPE